MRFLENAKIPTRCSAPSEPIASTQHNPAMPTPTELLPGTSRDPLPSSLSVCLSFHFYLSNDIDSPSGEPPSRAASRAISPTQSFVSVDAAEIRRIAKCRNLFDSGDEPTITADANMIQLLAQC